jgi:ubiquinone/menaquinone biosynthesis C-methylase UbiE
MNHHRYVHGYSERESMRLSDQAATLTDLLHHDTRYPRGSRVLEAGCGIGAQTRILAHNSPDAEIFSIDQSDESLAKATDLIEREGATNVRFQKADIFNLPYEDEYFDHIFVCFVLEHLNAPQKALSCLKRVLREGGTITVIEGDHGSCYFHPKTAEAVSAWHSLIEVQRRMGGDALIGRRVYPLLQGAGFRHPVVSPRMVYIDDRMPELQEGFIRRTIIPMVEGVSEEAMSRGIIDRESFVKGIEDLHRTATPAGTFCYTFFKGIGVR